MSKTKEVEKREIVLELRFIPSGLLNKLFYSETCVIFIFGKVLEDIIWVANERLNREVTIKDDRYIILEPSDSYGKAFTIEYEKDFATGGLVLYFTISTSEDRENIRALINLFKATIKTCSIKMIAKAHIVKRKVKIVNLT